MLANKIAYMYSPELIKQCDKLPTMQKRASLVHDLVLSYGLLSKSNVAVVQSESASREELELFHSTAYVDLLCSLKSFDTSLDEIQDHHLEHGLGYDCPVLDDLYNFALCIAGGTISAAKLIAAKKCRLAINWCGGWHHAMRDTAAGFCYVNDIVIAIQYMLKTFDRILYVDLDIHHGDGVQNAFYHTNKVLTLSFHKYSEGFFPRTGDVDDIGTGKGKYYTVNVPFDEGVCDRTLQEMFTAILPLIVQNYGPKCLMVQCGADGLNDDPAGECNLTLEGIGHCIKTLLNLNLPTIFLGGGGYNFPNVARLWTYLTSVIATHDLDNDIPEEAEYFSEYGPSYELHINAGKRRDSNTSDHLNMVIEKIKKRCSFIDRVGELQSNDGLK